METTIFKTVKGSTMETIFENMSGVVNVKYYTAKGAENNYNKNKSYKYEILVRHSENQDASMLFDKAIELSEKEVVILNIPILRKIFPKKNLGDREQSILSDKNAKVNLIDEGVYKVSCNSDYMQFTFEHPNYKDFTIIG